MDGLLNGPTGHRTRGPRGQVALGQGKEIKQQKRDAKQLKEQQQEDTK